MTKKVIILLIKTYFTKYDKLDPNINIITFIKI